MMGVFRRELRENLKWAAVIFGVLMVVVGDQIRNPSATMLLQWTQGRGLLLMPCAGLLMGVVQTLFEMRPDNWAFAVHRPVPRRRIFVAKCAAGLLLLYTALALPCVVITLWAARPGNLAEPFQWRMVLPMAADTLNAGCFYFAAMVLMLRRARWYGSRILPIGLALLCSMLVYMFIPEFWLAVVAIVLVQAVGAMAAWGAFAGNGATGRAAGPRLALGAMIYPGAVGLLLGISGFSQSFFSSGPGRWEYNQVDQKGRVLRVTQTIDGSTRGWQVADAAGGPVEGYEGIDLDDPANGNAFVRFNATLFDEDAVAWEMRGLQGISYRDSAPGLVGLRAIGPPGVRPRFSALYVVPQRIIDLYDPVSKALIGKVGPEGFVKAGEDFSRMARFPEGAVNLAGLGNRHALAFASAVYWMELDQRRVRLLFTPEQDDPVVSVAEIGPATNPDVAIATRRMLHVLRPTGEALFTVPFSPLAIDLGQSYLQPALLPEEGHLALQIMTFPWMPTLRHELVEVAADGTVVKRKAMPAVATLNGSKVRETALTGMIFPVAARPVLPGWILDQVIDTRIMEFSRLFTRCMIGGAVASLIATLVLGRWYGMALWKTVAWAMVNLFLGPAGVLVMLSLNARPARERCAACGKMRIIGRGPCAKCRAALGPAVLDGREIFEPVEAFEVAG